jgi:hypothetical protein
MMNESVLGLQQIGQGGYGNVPSWQKSKQPEKNESESDSEELEEE